jgi:RNA polymerase sigma-70 factor, ECF subfamily
MRAVALPPPPQTSDRDLVAACVAGDDGAWEEFVARFRPLVLRVAGTALARAGGDDPDGQAEDVAAEVFAELLANERRALTRFREPWSLSGWLSIVARRRASKLLRGARRQPQTLEDPTQMAADARSVISDVAQVEQADLVREQLGKLSDRDRLALQLFYEGGRSYKEVAEILDIPTNRIGTLLARARRRLARVLGI